MKPIAILYATREGRTRRIAEHLAATVRSRGRAAEVFDVAHVPPDLSLDSYSAAILAASVHGSKHEPEMLQFVKRNVAELEHHPTVFLSVSLSEAGAENPESPPQKRAQATADVERLIRQFLDETHWHPTRMRPVAGALLYTKYTDWAALDRIIDEVSELAQSSGSGA